MAVLTVGMVSPVSYTHLDVYKRQILECARKVIATTESKSQIKFEALPQDDPKQRCPDISKAKRLLGWEPKVELESGLRCV